MHCAQRIRARSVFLPQGGNLLLQKQDVLLRNLRRQLVGVRRAAEADEICNPVDEDGRLAAARACQQQKRALRRENRLKLHWIHAGKTLLYVSFTRGQKPLFEFLCHNRSCLK